MAKNNPLDNKAIEDLAGVLESHAIPKHTLKILPGCLEIHLTEGLPKGEIPGDEGRVLLMKYEQIFSALVPFCSERNLTTGYDPFNQIIKIYPIH